MRLTTSHAEFVESRALDLAAGVTVVDADNRLQRRSRGQLMRECTKRRVPFDPKTATHDTLAALLRENVADRQLRDATARIHRHIDERIEANGNRLVPVSQIGAY